ncbi:acyl-CoA mutase large subunit family protein [Carboxydothermus pertinax]|uniref:Methylmalonyl-CoA mutase n=1 Tax=Carboxydothermus pertinax TaxID=870242 RepID=A0A1L8CU87_9THEO|nr:methylmalonyl-CoA mutase family protein [Carboxydothermus pertinax]GAV22409.1 methylmalonyl-CoA mutase [Carboxydothermus pertinax]
MSDLKKAYEEWYKKYQERCPDCDEDFVTISGEPIKSLYTPLDMEGLDYLEKLGFPGEYPFTRGIHYNMYRGKVWTFRQFSGFATAKETNERYKLLLAKGQTGLSVAFDMPTIMGYDSDHPRAEGEVGRCGVAIDSLADMEELFDGIPLDKVSTSMTINGPAAVLWAMYIACAEKQGVPSEKLSGTIQNDILKEYIAQKSWIFPPEPSMRIITDIFAFGAKYVPRWNTVSISGYHIREAGATAVQELAFTLADGFAYVEAGIKAGLDVDEFAPRLSFFFNSHMDFFEEIAKFRAARRIWARRMKEKYGAKNPRSWLLRFHTQTAGCSLTAQQPENNIVRTAFEALAAVLGGTQSLHTNSMDEVLALPTEKAVTIALRTQQIIAHETGVINTIDPLGGSYFVEALTDKMEEEAEKYFQKIEELGGVIEAINKGFFQQEIADASYRYQQAVERKKRIIVGVNEYVEEEEKIDIPILKIDPEVEERQKRKVKSLRATRDNEKVEIALRELKEAARGTENLMPYILNAVRVYATEGEIIQSLKEVFGEYKEKPVF